MALMIIQDVCYMKQTLRWQKQSWRWILTLMLCLVIILLFLLIWTIATSPNKKTSELLNCSTFTNLITLRGCAWHVLTGTWCLDGLKSFSHSHTLSSLHDHKCIVRRGYPEVTLILNGSLDCFSTAYAHFFQILKEVSLFCNMRRSCLEEKGINLSLCIRHPSWSPLLPCLLFFPPIKGFIHAQPRCSVVAASYGRW